MPLSTLAPSKKPLDAVHEGEEVSDDDETLNVYKPPKEDAPDTASLHGPPETEEIQDETQQYHTDDVGMDYGNLRVVVVDMDSENHPTTRDRTRQCRKKGRTGISTNKQPTHSKRPRRTSQNVLAELPETVNSDDVASSGVATESIGDDEATYGSKSSVVTEDPIIDHNQPSATIDGDYDDFEAMPDDSLDVQVIGSYKAPPTPGTQALLDDIFEGPVSDENLSDEVASADEANTTTDRIHPASASATEGFFKTPMTKQLHVDTRLKPARLQSSKKKLPLVSDRHSNKRQSAETNSSLNTSYGDNRTPTWVENAQQYLPVEDEVDDSFDSTSSDKRTVKNSMLAYNPLTETDLMKYFVGQHRLNLLDLFLAPAEWWDRGIDEHLVTQFVRDIMVNPKLLFNANPIPAILLASRQEYHMFLVQGSYASGGKSFEAYFGRQICLAGGKIRFTAATRIKRDHPDQFSSLKDQYKTDFTSLLFNVFIHDKTDPVDTIPESLIIKVAACSNLENPGSGQLLLSDQIYISRKFAHVAVNQPIPKDPIHTEVPEMQKAAKVWRVMVWEAIKGGAASFSSGRGQLEPLLQFAKRPAIVVGTFFEFENALRHKISEFSLNNYSRVPLMTGYQLGFDGFNNMSNSGIVQVLNRCMSMLENPNYKFNTMPSIRKLLGVDFGVIYFCRLFKVRSALADYCLGELNFQSLEQLQTSYPGWFTSRKLEKLCQIRIDLDETVNPNTRQRQSSHDLPKLRPVMKNYHRGKAIPYKWSAHVNAAKRWLELLNKEDDDSDDDDVSLGFYRDATFDIPSVVFLTHGLTKLNRSSINHVVGTSGTWSGFDACIVDINVNDVTSNFDRINEIITQTLPLRQATHFNWLFLGGSCLSPLRDMLLTKKPTITTVQHIGFMYFPKKKKRTGGTDQFNLSNPLTPYLLAHYSPTGQLSTRNVDLAAGENSFVNKESLVQCYEQLVSWICPTNGWILSIHLSQHVAKACTTSAKNIVFCPDHPPDSATLANFRQVYGQYRTDLKRARELHAMGAENDEDEQGRRKRKRKKGKKSKKTRNDSSPEQEDDQPSTSRSKGRTPKNRP